MSTIVSAQCFGIQYQRWSSVRISDNWIHEISLRLVYLIEICYSACLIFAMCFWCLSWNMWRCVYLSFIVSQFLWLWWFTACICDSCDVMLIFQYWWVFWNLLNRSQSFFFFTCKFIHMLSQFVFLFIIFFGSSGLNKYSPLNVLTLEITK